MLRLLLIALLVLMTWVSPGCKRTEEKLAEKFQAYDEDCKARRADSAVMFLSQSSFDWFDQMLIKARTLPAAEVKKLPPSQMFEVVTMRNRLTAQELKIMSGREYIYSGIARGWADSEFEWQPDWEYQGLRVKGNRAILDFIVYGTAGKRFIECVKEGGEWKLDLAASDESYDADIRWAASQRGKSIEATILELEAGQTDRPVKANVWDPPK